jgi:4-hydroxybenzoate polyprenyltransferase
MELDQWKDIWKEGGKLPSNDSQKLHSLLAKKSKSPVSKMKRNLKVELWFVIITYGAMILFYFLAFKGRMSAVSWFMLFIGLLFVFYFQIKNKLLTEMECLSCEVKSNLQKQTITLEKYIRIYLIGGTLLAPVSLLFFGWFFYAKAWTNVNDTIFYPGDHNPIWKVVLVWVILTALVTCLFYLLNKWYVRKLYGKHVEKLKEVLNEMENEE